MKRFNLSDGNLTSSGFYVILANLFSRALSIITLFIVLHFLSATRLGEVYLLLLLFGISNQFGDFGLSITSFRQGVSPETARNTRIFLGVLQTIVALLIGLIAKLVVRDVSMYGLTIIALTSVLGLLSFGKEVTLRNATRYRTLSFISTCQQLTITGTEIFLLVFHVGYMSLIFGSLFGQILRVILILSIKPRQKLFHRFPINFKLLSKDISISSAFHFWTANIDKLFVQAILQTSNLALFTVGQTVGRIVDMTITQPLKVILNPIYASTGDVSRFTQFNKIEYRWTAFLTTLWATLLWCSPTVMLKVFPSTWHNALLPIQIFSLAGIISPFINITGTAMLSSGSAKIVRNYTGLRFVAILIFAGPMLLIFHLIGAALVDVLVDSFVVVPFILRKAPKVLKASELLKEIYPFLLVFLGCLSLSRVTSDFDVNSWISFILLITVYASLVCAWKFSILKNDLSLLINSLQDQTEV